MQRLSQLLAGGYLILAALVTVVTFVNGPLGPAPVALPVGVSREPVVVTIDYGTEKQAWLEAAVERFNATNQRVRGRPIQIQLEGIGSREIVTRIMDGSSKPTVVSPASSIQIELLRSEWQARNTTSLFLDGPDAPQPLVLTPLVLVMWQTRSQALWPNGPTGSFWGELHTAIADPQGWAARGQPGWGVVKFGHTSPETSNSGIQTLVLLAYAYHNKAANLTAQDILDPGFGQWLREIEGSMTEHGDSTGTFMQDMLLYGPSKYDTVAVYENLALQNIGAAQQRWSQNLSIYYPPATLLSDHPYAILNAPWVDADQRTAAARFRDFLLAQPSQELALQYGFRPVNPQVAISAADPNNPFNRFKSNGAQIDIQQQAAVPSADVLNALVEVWRQSIRQ